MDKICFKCGKAKPLSEFYRHSQMADGHLNKCKECAKRDVAKRRLAALDYYQKYDRERGQDPKRKAKVLTDYRKRVSTSEGRKKERERVRAWAARNREKHAVHIIVSNAIRDGRLKRGPCARCGTTRLIHAHHEDYGKPMEVTWLCRKHHGERHREINDERRTQHEH